MTKVSIRGLLAAAVLGLVPASSLRAVLTNPISNGSVTVKLASASAAISPQVTRTGMVTGTGPMVKAVLRLSGDSIMAALRT